MENAQLFSGKTIMPLIKEELETIICARKKITITPEQHTANDVHVIPVQSLIRLKARKSNQQCTFIN